MNFLLLDAVMIRDKVTDTHHCALKAVCVSTTVANRRSNQQGTPCVRHDPAKCAWRWYRALSRDLMTNDRREKNIIMTSNG